MLLNNNSVIIFFGEFTKIFEKVKITAFSTESFYVKLSLKNNRGTLIRELLIMDMNISCVSCSHGFSFKA